MNQASSYMEPRYIKAKAVLIPQCSPICISCNFISHTSLKVNSQTPWRQNPKVHHHIHNSPPKIPILSQVNPLSHSLTLPHTHAHAWTRVHTHTHTQPANLLTVHFDPILPPMPWSFKWPFPSDFPTKTLYTFLPSPMPCPP
jgi:hypothetical protein